MNNTKKTILIISVFLIINIFLKKITPTNNDNIFLLQSFIKLSFLIITLFLIIKDETFKLNLVFKNNFLSISLTILLIYLSVKHIFSEIIERKIIVSEYHHYTYFFQCITTGFFEEFFCRLLLFGLICNLLKTQNKGKYYIEILFTSLLFSMLHLSNLFNPEYDTISVINQSMFAFAFGVFLQCILIRFKNIILTATLHGLINYNGMANTKLFKIEHPSTYIPNAFEDFIQSFITFIILCLIVFTFGYFLVKNRKMEIIKL